MQSVPIHGRSPVPKMASCVKVSSKLKRNRFPKNPGHQPVVLVTRRDGWAFAKLDLDPSI